MKKLILALFIPFISLAQTKVNSKVVSVVIYKSGAQVVREATIDIKTGENNYVIKGISPEIDKNSIQVKFSDTDISLNALSHQLSLNNEDDFVNLNIKIAAKNTIINEEKKKLKIEQTLLAYQEKMLLNNQNVGGTYTGMKPEDLTKTVDYFELKMKKILNAQYLIDKKLDSLDFEIKDNNKDLNELSQNKENKLSEILMSLKSKQSRNQIKVSISYFVQNAGWSPTYDFNAKSLSKPLTVLYKAKVYQYSGEDWKDMKLTLSNTLPKKNATIPELKMWIWGIPNDYSKYTEETNTTAKLNEIWGNVKDEEGENIPGVSVTIVGTPLGVITDINGFYRIAIPTDRKKIINELMFSSIGFISQKVTANATPINIKLKTDNVALEEVVLGKAAGVNVQKLGSESKIIVRGYGSLNGNSYLTKANIEEKEKPVSMEFTLNESITLLSDGKEKTLDLKELEIPVDYLYKSTPKIDPVAFLTAQIVDWEQFNFIEGEANLYFEGTFLGKSTLDLSNKDTLNLSIGRDESIKVERKLVKKYSKRQILGSNVQSDYIYEVSLRNTKNQDIKIQISDQFPITANKDVDIFNKEAPEATIDKDSGIITWNFNLKKSSEKTLKLNYSVKYPKSLMADTE